MSIKDCPRVSITDVLSFIVDNRGKTVPTAETGTPLIATNCILNERLYPVFENIRYVSDDILKSWFRAHLEPHDILFVNKGTPGRCCLVPDPVTFCAAQDMIGLRCDAQKIYYRYLLMVLRSPEIQKTISNNHVGLAIPHFKKENLPQLMIPVPDIEEQKALGDLYFLLCEKIENNKAICSDLEAMAKLLYDYWFVQFDFPDENGKPYKSSGGKMVWNEELKREIPEGWDVRNILDVCDIVDCLHSKKPDYCYEHEDAYLLTLENLTKDGLIDLTKKYYISKQDYSVWTSKIEVHEGDFVVTNAGRAGDIGRIPKNVKCAIGRNLTAIRPNKIESVYLHMFLHSFYFKAQIINNLDQGSFFMSFNVHAIKKIKVLVPSKAVMEKTLETFTNIVQHIEMLNEENQQLASLRDFLLPMLMNGQVTFKDNR